MYPRGGLDTSEREIYLPLLEIETRILCHKAHTLRIPINFQLNVLTAIITYITLPASMK